MMLDPDSISHLLAERVPFARTLGIRIERVDADRSAVVLPFAHELSNHVGTVHAAAIFGLGESAAGALVLVTFGDLQQQGYVPLVAGASITYRRPASGDLRAEATLSPDTQARIRADLASAGKARFPMRVTISNPDGETAAELDVDWAVITPREPKG